MGNSMRGLDSETEIALEPNLTHRAGSTRSTRKCVALISDGRDCGAPLDYAIDVCVQEQADIDLLLHDAADGVNHTTMEQRIRAAGLGCHSIRLGTAAVDGILDYAHNHRSLIFLVAMPDDAAIKILVEELLPKRRVRMPVPLVLIEEKQANQNSKTKRPEA
jgi:hypothetical protein